MILKYGVKVKKREFSFPISEYLDKAITALIDACNNDDPLADCYMSELYNEINNSLHIEITDEQANELRDYYLRGGMYAEN